MEKSLLQKIKILSILLLSGLGLSVLASGRGGRGDALMRAPMGAYATSLGGAATARPAFGDAWWNPAYSASRQANHLSAGVARKSLDRGEHFLAYDGAVSQSPFGYSVLFRHSGFLGLDSLRDDQGEILESGDNYSLMLMGGLSFRVQDDLFLGVSTGWRYNTLPTDFHGTEIEQRTSSGFGGISLFAMYTGLSNLTVSGGVRELFLDQSWSSDDATAIYFAIEDTALTPFTVSLQHDPVFSAEALSFSYDVDVYLFSHGFQRLDHPFLMANMGVEWGANEVVQLRAGVMDILLDGFVLNPDEEVLSEKYRPLFTGGFGVQTDSIIDFYSMVLNYSLRGSSVGAGFDHAVDFVFQF
ncbi:hypothetical protein [Chitinivibrio alkaliphilus]|uniref:PorV/PorQ family protein n=1 Tax=Chitinivibrio alkaliphilus ACht1 TaxID=1313304 RepID=U7D9Y8_9BACT|nr:hypothetical protein [Chitinivibrio alkaliphilus]ERP38802.1 hypothetical protein CALK_0572 [Chitinivibrio alkaliphilus ACht1]